MAVYFIQRGEEVKIGYTGAAPQGRLATLQTGCPDLLSLLFVVPNADTRCEAFLHRKFKSAKVRGEWFTFSPEIKDFIKAIERARERKKSKEEEARKEREKAWVERIEYAAYLRREEREYERYMEAEEERYWAAEEKRHYEEEHKQWMIDREQWRREQEENG